MPDARPVAVSVYVGLGANVGERLERLREAVRALDETAGVHLVEASPVYETRAHTLDPDEEQPDFLNAVVHLRTTLSPEALLQRCQVLEREAGRDGSRRWAPRPLDLDLLVYGGLTCRSEELMLPHPRLAERRFVLRPLVDLAPGLRVPPPFNASAAELLRRCADPDVPRRTDHVLYPPEPSMSELPPSLPDHLRYVVIEGVIGAGKTSLARLLADHFDGQLVLEEFEENPFLERFYEDPNRWAFQTQLNFLASRFRQQKALFARDLFHQVTISDYSFDKDRIFAHLNLEGDELQLYETLYTLMQPQTPTPDLVVYLQSTTERLMDNIRERGRSYEANMDPDYIAALNEAYHYYFQRYTGSPLLVVNATHIDFVKNPGDLEELVRRVVETRHEGRAYFNPTPSLL